MNNNKIGTNAPMTLPRLSPTTLALLSELCELTPRPRDDAADAAGNGVSAVSARCRSIVTGQRVDPGTGMAR